MVVGAPLVPFGIVPSGGLVQGLDVAKSNLKSWTYLERTQCTICTHSMYYLYSHNALFVLTQCTICTHSMYYLYSHNALFVLTQCTICTHTMHYLYSRNALFVLTQCTICTHTMHYLYSHNVLFIFTCCLNTEYANIEIVELTAI